ncbi:MAG TPA: hypothetical protein VHK28_08145, partial [Candidatus Limnocylindria bacterium]|nr:hypothetical protein [Candidatus Limnocylindria bacterium]
QPPSPADRDPSAELEARIAELERRSWRQTVDEGRSGMEEAFWALMHRLFPEEARKHLKTAGREQLMAARVYLDKWIERLDEEEQAATAARPHEKIEIE